MNEVKSQIELQTSNRNSNTYSSRKKEKLEQQNNMENNSNVDEYEFDEDESINSPTTSKSVTKESIENESESLGDEQRPLKRKSNETDNENEEDDAYAIRSLNDYIRTHLSSYLKETSDDEEQTNNEPDFNQLLGICSDIYPYIDKSKIIKSILNILTEIKEITTSKSKQTQNNSSKSGKSKPEQCSNDFSKSKSQKTTSNQRESTSSPKSVSSNQKTSERVANSPNSISLKQTINELKNAKKMKTSTPQGSSQETTEMHKKYTNTAETSSSRTSTNSPLITSNSPYENKMNYANSTFANLPTTSSQPASTMLPGTTPLGLNPAAGLFGAMNTPGLNLNGPLFDPEFLRMAANPLLRFHPDFSNPYLNNFGNIFKPNSTSSSSASTFNAANIFSPLSQYNTSQQTSIPQFGTTTNKVSSYEPKIEVKSDSPFVQKQNGILKGNMSNSSSSNISKSTKSSNSNSESSGNHLSLKITNGIANSQSASSKFKLSSKFSKLSSSEAQTIKNLISSYRESAAFLTRSADELEQLINESYES